MESTIESMCGIDEPNAGDVIRALREVGFLPKTSEKGPYKLLCVVFQPDNVQKPCDMSQELVEAQEEKDPKMIPMDTLLEDLDLMAKMYCDLKGFGCNLLSDVVRPHYWMYGIEDCHEISIDTPFEELDLTAYMLRFLKSYGCNSLTDVIGPGYWQKDEPEEGKRKTPLDSYICQAYYGYLDIRIEHCLEKAGYIKMFDLVGATIEELKNVPGIGKLSIDEIKKFVEENGYELREK